MADKTLKPESAALIESLNSPKQRKFVIAYVANNGNGTAAAKEAGYANPAQDASRLLKVDKVVRAIQKHARKVTTVAGETRDTVLARMINRANVNPQDYFHKVPVMGNDGTPLAGVFTEELKHITDLTKEQAQCIKKITPNAHGISIEFHDPAAADRDIASMCGWIAKDGEALTPEGAASLIAASLAAMDEVGGA
jgi:hypothetical protein